MVLELIKDMPRGRAESLSRLFVPLLVAMALVLSLVLVGTAGDARVAGELRRQVEQQARTAGVLFLDDRVVVPSFGVRDVPVLVDGRPVEGRIIVDGDTATLQLRSPDGSFAAAVSKD